MQFDTVSHKSIYKKLSLSLPNSDALLPAPSTWTVRHSRSDSVINIMLHANAIPSVVSPFSGERLAWQQIENMGSVFHSCNSFDLSCGSTIGLPFEFLYKGCTYCIQTKTMAMRHFSGVEEFTDSACSPLGLVVKYSLLYPPDCCIDSFAFRVLVAFTIFALRANWHIIWNCFKFVWVFLWWGDFETSWAHWCFNEKVLTFTTMLISFSNGNWV